MPLNFAAVSFQFFEVLAVLPTISALEIIKYSKKSQNSPFFLRNNC